MAGYFDGVIGAIQKQRWHSQCGDDSLQALQAIGLHSCILRNDHLVVEAVKLGILRNLRSVDEPLSSDEIKKWEGSHPQGVLVLNRTPIMTAIWLDRLDALKLLRTAGASFTAVCIDDNRNTALHYAMMLNRDEMVQYILPLLPKTKLFERNGDGDTPLHLAARRGHFSMIRTFVDYVNKVHENDTFLWKQLHHSNIGDAPSSKTHQQPPPSFVVQSMVLSQSYVDDTTVAHIIALHGDVCPTEAADVLSRILECAESNDCIKTLLTRIMNRKGESLLVACSFVEAWRVVYDACRKCQLEMSWEAMQVDQDAATGTGGIIDTSDELSIVQDPIVGSGSLRVPIVLAKSGETPFHRIAQRVSDGHDGSGMVRAWTEMYTCISTTNVTPSLPPPPPPGISRRQIFEKLFCGTTSRSPWYMVTEGSGLTSGVAQDMLVTVRDASAEESTEQTTIEELQDDFESTQRLKPDLAASWDSLKEAAMQRELSSLVGRRLWLCNKELSARNTRRVLHNIAYVGDATGARFVQREILAPLLAEVRAIVGPYLIVDESSAADAVTVSSTSVAQQGTPTEGGASAAPRSVSPLAPQPISAARQAHLEETACVLRHGLNVLNQVFSQFLCPVDQDGFSPLQLASLRNHGPVIYVLCEMADSVHAEAVAVMQRLADTLFEFVAARRAAAAALVAATDASRSLKRVPSVTGVATTSNALKKAGSFASNQALAKSTSLSGSGAGSPPLEGSSTIVAVQKTPAEIKQELVPDVMEHSASMIPAPFVTDWAWIVSRAPAPTLTSSSFDKMHLDSVGTITDFLSRNHPVRMATNSLRTAVEASSTDAVECLLTCFLSRLRSAMQQRVDQASSDMCLQALMQWLESGGNDEHQHRDVLLVCIHRGDFATLCAIFECLCKVVEEKDTPDDLVCAIQGVFRRLALHSWKGTVGQYFTTSSLRDDMKRFCVVNQAEGGPSAAHIPLWPVNNAVQGNDAENVDAALELLGEAANPCPCCIEPDSPTTRRQCPCKTLSSALRRYVSRILSIARSSERSPSPNPSVTSLLAASGGGNDDAMIDIHTHATVAEVHG